MRECWRQVAAFKAQLTNLMRSIRATAPNYVRCLKPNDANVPDVLDRHRIVVISRG